MDKDIMQKNIEVLSKNKTCTSCGGDIHLKTGICPYCGKHFVNIEYAALELSKYLPTLGSNKLELDELAVGLYAIKDDFPELEDFIRKNNLEERILKKLDSINIKLTNEEVLSTSDDIFLRSCLSNEIRPSKELNYISVFRNILLEPNKKIVSYDTFVEVMKCYITDVMKAINNNRIKKYNPLCAIYDFKRSNDERCDGLAYKNFIIRINESVIKDIYDNNYILELVTIFHELRHIGQNIAIDTGEFNEEILIFIKDEILRDLCHKEGFDYYRENYKYLASEIDAEANGLYYMIIFIEQVIGLNLKNDVKNSLNNDINSMLKKSNLIRRINGKEDDINTLFDYYIKEHPKYLKTYPQLNIEYIVDNGTVRRKNSSELFDTMMLHKDNSAIRDYLTKIIAIELDKENRKVNR